MAAWSNVMGAWGEVERLCFRPTPRPLDERLGGGRIADLGAGDDIDEGVAALAPGLRQLGPAVQLLRAVAGFLVLARGHEAGVGEVRRGLVDPREALVVGIDDGDLVAARQLPEARVLEARVAHLQRMAQRQAAEFAGQPSPD